MSSAQSYIREIADENQAVLAVYSFKGQQVFFLPLSVRIRTTLNCLLHSINDDIDLFDGRGREWAEWKECLRTESEELN